MMEFHIWDLNGYVNLDNEFLDYYEKTAKEHGVCKRADEANVPFNTFAIYNKEDKLVHIASLKKFCNNMNIDLALAEKAVKTYTGNLKNVYKVIFPITLTPELLRLVSMIIGDGWGSSNRVCRWSQHKRNIGWGSGFIQSVIGFRPHIGNTCTPNCKAILIPNFAVKSVIRMLDIGEIKTYDFFRAVCKLSRRFRFQVFSQLVVDEGSPDNCFSISQTSESIRSGIKLLLESLDYRYTEYKQKEGYKVYINVESFPTIKRDFDIAKEKYGKFGAFWFKDERFQKAFDSSDPDHSKAIRTNKEKFDSAINSLRRKTTLNSKDIKNALKIPESCVYAGIRRAIRLKTITRLSHDLYTFSENLNNEDIKRLALTKEEKVMNLLSERKCLTLDDIRRHVKLSRSQLFRATTNLMHQSKIKRIRRGSYSIC